MTSMTILPATPATPTPTTTATSTTSASTPLISLTATHAKEGQAQQQQQDDDEDKKEDREDVESNASTESTCSTCTSSSGSTSRSRSRSRSRSPAQSVSSTSSSSLHDDTIPDHATLQAIADLKRPRGRPRRAKNHPVAALLKDSPPPGQPQTEANENSRKGLAQNLRTTHSVLVEHGLVNKDGNPFPVSASSLSQYIGLQAERMRRGEIQFSSLNWYLHSMRKLHNENGWEWDSVRKHPTVVEAWNAAKALTTEAAAVRARQRAAKELLAKEHAEKEGRQRHAVPSAKASRIARVKEYDEGSRGILTDDEEAAAASLASLAGGMQQQQQQQQQQPSQNRGSRRTSLQRLDFSGNQPSMVVSSRALEEEKKPVADSSMEATHWHNNVPLPASASTPSGESGQPLPSPISSPTSSSADRKHTDANGMPIYKDSKWSTDHKTGAAATPGNGGGSGGMSDQELLDIMAQARREIERFRRFPSEYAFVQRSMDTPRRLPDPWMSYPHPHDPHHHPHHHPQQPSQALAPSPSQAQHQHAQQPQQQHVSAYYSPFAMTPSPYPTMPLPLKRKRATKPKKPARRRTKREDEEEGGYYYEKYPAYEYGYAT
ncbi:uncharacterized protein SPPG_01810 [Spizellomyces punctatus DAOM BR117]|uniref:Uncharacterized protein n=1 Tax=Spizellomyces punctatus (strain DAOM BR117) TaxID=645134 RepID=A0A0L0HNR3_SPIPD|nr:uncharacterized protein SPPG_01810 [Spizellomyces punctatus DAOM BR117]KND02727.1 hypothetical protein SPPG_01810 [Spizellomyces punctatus DAOM BR117]|eukprot:XP_016610766.1 hypothetical protein SPPG_01810 [Spizellomyces punctatus DAOM BR117]